MHSRRRHARQYCQKYSDLATNRRFWRPEKWPKTAKFGHLAIFGLLFGYKKLPKSAIWKNISGNTVARALNTTRQFKSPSWIGFRNYAYFKDLLSLTIMERFRRHAENFTDSCDLSLNNTESGGYFMFINHLKRTRLTVQNFRNSSIRYTLWLQRNTWFFNAQS